MPSVRPGPDGTDPLFLFLTDIHLSGRRPRWRTDDYITSLLSKLKEAYEIAEKMGAPRVIIGGDITEASAIGLELGDKAVDIMEASDIPTYVVVGNHDLRANSLDTLSSVWLGHIFRRSSKVRKLGRIVDNDTAIVGIHFDDGIEDYLRSSGCKLNSSQGFYPKVFDADGERVLNVKADVEQLIEVVHAMILPKGSFPDSRSIAVNDVRTSAHMVLSGDNHAGWPGVITRLDQTHFINPGALARKSTDKSDLSRIPKVALVRRDLSAEFIELKSAQQAEDVFDIEGATADKEHQRTLDQRMREVRETTVEKIDVRERLVEVAKEMKASPEAKREALDRYDRVIGAV